MFIIMGVTPSGNDDLYTVTTEMEELVEARSTAAAAQAAAQRRGQSRDEDGDESAEADTEAAEEEDEEAGEEDDVEEPYNAFDREMLQAVHEKLQVAGHEYQSQTKGQPRSNCGVCSDCGTGGKGMRKKQAKYSCLTCSVYLCGFACLNLHNTHGTGTKTQKPIERKGGGVA